MPQVFKTEVGAAEMPAGMGLVGAGAGGRHRGLVGAGKSAAECWGPHHPHPYPLRVGLQAPPPKERKARDGAAAEGAAQFAGLQGAVGGDGAGDRALGIWGGALGMCSCCGQPMAPFWRRVPPRPLHARRRIFPHSTRRLRARCDRSWWRGRSGARRGCAGA